MENGQKILSLGAVGFELGSVQGAVLGTVQGAVLGAVLGADNKCLLFVR